MTRTHTNFLPLALLMLALTLVACSADVTESPVPPTSSADVLPARPRELPLEQGLDPCLMLTPSQQGHLGVGKGRPGVASDGFNSPACVWSRFPQEPLDSYLVQLVTQQGAEFALHSTTGARVVQIGDFAAVETQRDERYPVEFHCVLLIDVAAGQSLWVQYDYDGSTVPMTKQLACDKAKVAAEMAVQTLIEQSGG
ncbi:DUF3558 domain-containing protein [Pseudonocardia xinjiangensis]|uniref:DUF3558 domain-containing protein n=1 Tax=Pseudonocardia xinjiangensis TaxID=75289 RepID=UPI003D8E154D